MSGNKPELSVSIVPKGSQDPKGDRVNVMAAWRHDGRLSFQLDRDVEQLALKLKDGRIVRISRGEDGKATHWINCWEERPRTVTHERGPDPASAPTQPADDFGTDDIPF